MGRSRTFEVNDVLYKVIACLEPTLVRHLFDARLALPLAHPWHGVDDVGEEVADKPEEDNLGEGWGHGGRGGWGVGSGGG